MAKQKEEDETT
jgi:hypothetical protein